MRKSSGDEMILSYNDVVLRRSDLHVLDGPRFLNDRIIEFYLTYLSTSRPSDQILMVSPSISFWIMNCPDKEGLRDFVEPLKLPSRNLVIFPVNNNDDVDVAEGGSHWSLLAFERNANVFVHHDSSKGINDLFATRLYKAVGGFLGNSADLGAEPRYVKCSSSPQQQNGYDCGLYVLATAEVIHDWYRDSGSQDKESLWFSVVNERVTPSAVVRLRGEISELIRGLMAHCL
ncbi:hypothetical protein MLD38_004005 [Melastoma candidum]|uniref:Uncharacterized protein n=1 Tax=Melastoma candidum TaxID=119954 RepID=A0ACB9S5V9_9MYRT|nr:hypothetical protein MLD38_004005 [Melastoma candidum]